MKNNLARKRNHHTKNKFDKTLIQGTLYLGKNVGGMIVVQIDEVHQNGMGTGRVVASTHKNYPVGAYQDHWNPNVLKMLTGALLVLPDGRGLPTSFALYQKALAKKTKNDREQRA